MEPKVDEVHPKLAPLLSISNREFKEQFGHLAGSWRGKKPLQRNALIALANLGGKEALPEIKACLQDQRPVIRGTAVWALGQLTKKAPEETIGLLQELKETETDPEVLTEIANVLERLS